MSCKISTMAIIAILLLEGCVTAEKSATEAPLANGAPASADATPLKPTEAGAQPVPTEAHQPVGPTEEMGPDAALLGNEQGDDEPELTPEDFEEGFCVDDIYAKYLTARYEAEHAHHKAPKVVASKKSKRSRHRRGHASRPDRQEQRLSDFAALAYAHQVMAGRTTAYFGAIPIVSNDRVDFWVQYFKTSGRKMFMRWLVRGETLKQMVQPILQEGGVPMEFFYLAMIESGLSNSAYSRARATGTWQFMRGTAQLYGLKINHWVDERRDPIKSTIAAASYLKDLYADLGDWHLAMAAYNAGPGKVRKALKRNGGTADFWALCETRDLAHETKDYVPKVLAAVMLAADPKAHGFDVQPDAGDGIPETEVIVKRPARLEELSKMLGVPVKTLSTWNPELIHNVVPPTKGGYSLRLSSYYANLFQNIEQKLPVVDVKDVQMHTVRKGETLSRIARKYKVGVKQILSVNPDLSAGKLKPGRTIAIPVPGIAAMKSEASAG